MSTKKKVILIILVSIVGLTIAVGALLLSFKYGGRGNDYLFGIKGLVQFTSLSIGINIFLFVLIWMGKKVVEIIDGDIAIKHEIYTWRKELAKQELNNDDKTLPVRITKLDNHFFNFIVKRNWKYALIGFMISIGYIVICINIALVNKELEFGYAFGTPFFTAGFILFLSNLLPKGKYTLDRMNGTIRLFCFPISFIVDFRNIKPFNIFGYMYFKHPFFKIPLRVYGDFGASSWSFYVQYMDKNLPLPKGSAFDEYREKDFLRRKAEGFPKPKYKIDRDMWLCDASEGYIYGTEEFKAKLSKSKLTIGKAGTPIIQYIFFDIGDKEFIQNEVVLLGFYQDYFVFKYGAPKNKAYVILKEEPTDCFMVHYKTKRMEVKGNAYPKVKQL